MGFNCWNESDLDIRASSSSSSSSSTVNVLNAINRRTAHGKHKILNLEYSTFPFWPFSRCAAPLWPSQLRCCENDPTRVTKCSECAIACCTAGNSRRYLDADSLPDGSKKNIYWWRCSKGRITVCTIRHHIRSLRQGGCAMSTKSLPLVFARTHLGTFFFFHKIFEKKIIKKLNVKCVGDGWRMSPVGFEKGVDPRQTDEKHNRALCLSTVCSLVCACVCVLCGCLL